MLKLLSSREVRRHVANRHRRRRPAIHEFLRPYQQIVDDGPSPAMTKRVGAFRLTSRLLSNHYISDVGHPKPIDHHRYHMARQVGPNPPAMPGVRRRRTERLSRHAQQIVHPPQLLHSLVVHRPPGTLQQHRDDAISVMPVGERETTDFIPHRGFFLPRRPCLPISVVSGPARPGQPVHPFDLDALLLNLRVDHRVDTVSPGPPFDRRDTPACRKAARKKSRSRCCWPTLRSSSAIRRWATAAASSGRGIAGASTAAAGTNTGWPICCNASGPCASYFRRHLYNIRAEPLTPPPARSRLLPRPSATSPAA